MQVPALQEQLGNTDFACQFPMGLERSVVDARQPCGNIIDPSRARRGDKAHEPGQRAWQIRDGQSQSAFAIKQHTRYR